MNYLIKYDEYNLNEGKLKDIAIGTAFVASTLGAGYHFMKNAGTAKLDKEISIGSDVFKKYSTYTVPMFTLIVSNEGLIVSSHDVTEGSGDDEKTVTYNTINLKNGTNEFWYKNNLLSSKVYVNYSKFKDSKNVKLSELRKIKETDEYILYHGKMLHPFDYVILHKDVDVTSKKFAHFSLSDYKLNHQYIYKRIYDECYLISLGSLGGGNFGGGGAGQEY
jgi:hypothetical protein